MTRSVIVGVDGSPPSTRAADFGAALAVRHQVPLRLVHVLGWPTSYPPLLPDSVAVRVDPHGLATDLVQRAAADIRARYPRLPVETSVLDGNPAGTLVDLSRRAAWLVVGHRGLGGFSELLLGSVGVHTTTHARCPVVVVRGESPPADAPVLVGVDGSMQARVAAVFAFEEARARGTDLVVALAWPPSRVWPEAVAAAGLPPHPDEVDPLQVSLADTADRFPDVKVRKEIRHGDSAAQVIITVADEVHAGLVVVGSRGIGGFRSLLVGGTCRALVDHSPCPVMVIPKHA